MAAKPRRIRHILQHQPALASLYNKAQQQDGLLAGIRQELPPPLGRHCVSAVLGGSILTISADSPVWAAKLRFHSPHLLSGLRKAHPGIGNIRIRIAAPPDKRPSPAPRIARHHSDRAAATVAQASTGISDPSLVDALQRLAKTLREN